MLQGSAGPESTSCESKNKWVPRTPFSGVGCEPNVRRQCGKEPGNSEADRSQPPQSRRLDHQIATQEKAPSPAQRHLPRIYSLPSLIALLLIREIFRDRNGDFTSCGPFGSSQKSGDKATLLNLLHMMPQDGVEHSPFSVANCH